VSDLTTQFLHPARLTWTPAVTGWKSVFVNKAFTKRIVELTKDESDVILTYLFSVGYPRLSLTSINPFSDGNTSWFVETMTTKFGSSGERTM
jgi:hypothetical protein